MGDPVAGDGVAALGADAGAELKVLVGEHPVVRTHPETGRKSLFVNSGFTSHIVQLSGGESQVLLNMLFDLVAREPVLSCRVRWTPNSLVFWDNRCTQHYAVMDYWPAVRKMERAGIVGEAPGDRLGGLWPSDHAGVWARVRLN